MWHSSTPSVLWQFQHQVWTTPVLWLQMAILCGIVMSGHEKKNVQSYRNFIPDMCNKKNRFRPFATWRNETSMNRFEEPAVGDAQSTTKLQTATVRVCRSVRHLVLCTISCNKMLQQHPASTLISAEQKKNLTNFCEHIQKLKQYLPYRMTTHNINEVDRPIDNHTSIQL